jgi:hypothetical protein
MEPQDFQSFFKERLRDRGISLRRASEITGIPLNYLESLASGEIEKLPPWPYLRGYLMRLGRVLDFDPQPWEKEFKEKQAVKTAGPQDKLPQNRFAIKATTKRLWLALGVLVALGYLGFRFYSILGKPQLNVVYPGEPLISVNEETITVWGFSNGDKVFVNRDEVAIGKDRKWQKRIQLQPGLNTVEVSAKKLLGGETKILRQVVYEALSPRTATSTLP